MPGKLPDQTLECYSGRLECREPAPTTGLGFRAIQKIATIHASSLDLDQNQILPTLISLTHETEVHLGMSVQSQKGSKCRWHNHRSIRRVSIIT